MKPPRDDQLTADLNALRPKPRPQFAAELDAHAAAGFPRRSPRGVPAFFTAIGTKRPAHPRRLLIPAGGVAVVVIAVITALIIGGSGSNSSESGSGASSGLLSQINTLPGHTVPEPSAAASEEASGAAVEAEAPAAEGANSAAAESRPIPMDEALAPVLHHRAVERAAEITLAANPKDVDDDTSRVFEAVHANNGIVMRSSTEEGRPGEAGATFDLLIPGARLDDAMAAFSDIDAIRSRHESTADITAPTVSAAELLKESRARIDSLLAQLGTAETEEEQEAIEAELRHERRHASRLAAQLTHLHKRADFSRVSLRIETGGKESSGGGAWGVDDALHDAGHVLTIVAAVTLIALAILGPLAVLALLAWLIRRAWVRRARRRVLN
jgi:uncharacterized protein DUF4349